MDGENTLTKWTGRKSLTPSQIGGRQAPPPDSGQYQPQAEEEEATRFPRQGEEYIPHSAFSSRLKNSNRRMLSPKMLHFLDANCWSTGFSYGDLRRVSWEPDSKAGGSPQLVLRFIESEITDVVIQGRNLEEIRHGVSEGYILWVRMQPAHGIQLYADNETVVTSIVQKKVGS